MQIKFTIMNPLRNIVHRVKLGKKEQGIYKIATDARKSKVTVKEGRQKPKTSKTDSENQREIYENKYTVPHKFAYIDY